MASSITTTGIDTAYPAAGQDNDSPRVLAIILQIPKLL